MLRKAKEGFILGMCVCVEVGGISRQCQCAQAYQITRSLAVTVYIYVSTIIKISRKTRTHARARTHAHTRAHTHTHTHTHRERESLLQFTLLEIISLSTVTQFHEEWMTEYEENKE